MCGAAQKAGRGWVAQGYPLGLYDCSEGAQASSEWVPGVVAHRIGVMHVPGAHPASYLTCSVINCKGSVAKESLQIDSRG
jgi:hypothetical protein